MPKSIYKHLPNSGSFQKGHKGYKGMLDKHLSKEAKLKLSNANKGREVSEKDRIRLKKMSFENAEKCKARRIKTVCANCGKKLELVPSVYNKNGNFCSKKCSNVFHKEIIREKRKGIKLSEITKDKLRKYKREKTSNWKGGKPKCKICNKEISYRATYCLKHKHLLWDKEKWEKAWNGSKKNVGKMPKNMQRPGKWRNIVRGYFNINGKEIFFRSKWEANYALYLDFLIKQKQIKRWTYEEDVFIFEEIKFGTRSYRPDFKVYIGDKDIEYHEVKGYMTSRSKTQIKRMAKYYPNIKLIIVDRDVYKDIKNKVGKMLKFY